MVRLQISCAALAIRQAHLEPLSPNLSRRRENAQRRTNKSQRLPRYSRTAKVAWPIMLMFSPMTLTCGPGPALSAKPRRCAAPPVGTPPHLQARAFPGFNAVFERRISAKKLMAEHRSRDRRSLDRVRAPNSERSKTSSPTYQLAETSRHRRYAIQRASRAPPAPPWARQRDPLIDGLFVDTPVPVTA
jgi:hypothetical protein